MTTDRPYRRALSVPTALAELDRVAGTQLDSGELDHLFALADVPPSEAMVVTAGVAGD